MFISLKTGDIRTQKTNSIVINNHDAKRHVYKLIISIIFFMPVDVLCHDNVNVTRYLTRTLNALRLTTFGYVSVKRKKSSLLGVMNLFNPHMHLWLVGCKYSVFLRCICLFYSWINVVLKKSGKKKYLNISKVMCPMFFETGFIITSGCWSWG